MESIEYGDYIIYVDESGDPSLNNNYADHPVFVLTFCIFSKHDYLYTLELINKVKFEFWGNDLTILHSSKIRKLTGDFSKLQKREDCERFYAVLNSAIDVASFSIISTAIDKRLLAKQYRLPDNPYTLALTYCMERVYRFLEEKKQNGKETHIIIESRGKKEDFELGSTFMNILDSKPFLRDTYPSRLIFSDKKTNSVGLQLADLAAYPIARYAVDPQKNNPAFEILIKKFHRFPDHLGKGLKIFPYETSKFQISSEKRKTPDYSEVSAD